MKLFYKMTTIYKNEIPIKIINDMFKSMIHKYLKYNNSKYAEIVKKLYYSTHLNGPHIDFFNSPQSFNKSELFENLKRFQKKIILSIGYLIDCEKSKCYLNFLVVEKMINQIKKILVLDDIYWKNHGFIENEILSINKSYQMYLCFLETYILRVDKKTTHIKSKLYEACIFKHFGTNINPSQLLDFALLNFESLKSQIKHFNNSTTKSSLIKTDTELFSTVMTHILNLYNKQQNSNNVIYPEPHKIKMKQISLIYNDVLLESIVEGRHIFFNDLNPQFYTKDKINLLVAHDTIDGIMTTNLNITKSQKYIDDYFKVNKKMINFKQDITNMIFNLNYYHEGLATLSEKNINLESKLSLLERMVITNILMIVDIGLHFNNLKLSFNLETAKEFIKSNMLKLGFTITENEIDIYLLKILSNPANVCVQEFARHVMEKHKRKLENLGYDFHDLIYHIPFDVTTMTNFINKL